MDKVRKNGRKKEEGEGRGMGRERGRKGRGRKRKKRGGIERAREIVKERTVQKRTQNTYKKVNDNKIQKHQCIEYT